MDEPRFNPNHGAAGSATGGQFVSAGGGGGGSKTPAKAPARKPPPGKAPAGKAAPGKGEPPPAHTPREHLLAEAHADREKAAKLETQLHVLEKQHAAAVAAAKHSASQAAKAKAAGHPVHHHHHTAAHHHHRKHAATLATRIGRLRTEIHTLRQKAAALEKQAKTARSLPGFERAVSELQFGHGSALWKYWTAGKGLAKWSGALHKWRTLRDLLLKAGVPAHSVDGLTTNIIMAVMPGYMKLAHAKGGSGMKSASHAPDLDVVRSGGGLELQDGGGPLGTLTGRFSEFNRWYPVASKFEGDFLERVSPGSTADTIRDGRDAMRVLFDHGTDRQIGNKVLGPIDVLEERADGPYYEVPLFDTSYNRDLLPGLKAGVYGASMRMRVMGDQWNDTPDRSASNPEGIPERTITAMQVLEFGPVTFPANPGASAGVRSGTDEFYFRMREINTAAFEDAVRASGLPRECFDELPVIGRPSAGAGAASDREGDATEFAEPDPTLTARFRRDGEALALRGIGGVKLR